MFYLITNTCENVQYLLLVPYTGKIRNKIDKIPELMNRILARQNKKVSRSGNQIITDRDKYCEVNKLSAKLENSGKQLF